MIKKRTNDTYRPDELNNVKREAMSEEHIFIHIG